MSPEILLLIGTLFGGAGLKIIERYMNKGKEQVDFASQIRDELRKDLERYQEEVESYKEEVKGYKQEVREWKDKYYTLLEDQGKLKDTNLDQQNQIGTLRTQIQNMSNLLKKHNISYDHEQQ